MCTSWHLSIADRDKHICANSSPQAVLQCGNTMRSMGKAPLADLAPE